MLIPSKVIRVSSLTSKRHKHDLKVGAAIPAIYASETSFNATHRCCKH